MHLNDAVPWGRSLDEYQLIFNLTPQDLQRSILGCSDGPASFNAELTAAGGTVISCDPIYAFTAAQIRSRIAQVYPEIMDQMPMLKDNFVWDYIPSIDALGEMRMNAMNAFLDDYAQDGAASRYINAELPDLPFEDNQFDLALCSHFLFLYSAQFSFDFHRRAVKELIRVASEVRIFPLLDLSVQTSAHLEPICLFLEDRGHTVIRQRVDYEFQKGGNEMLRIIKRA